MFEKQKSKGKVYVGLSGGVDSAVSAALLQRQGYEVTGVFIRIAIPGYPCTAGEDKVDAQRVAAHLRMPFIEIDLSEEYEEEVFRTSIAEFKKGNTPNPDTLCNQKIKFGAFFEFAKSCGADFIATGHYARTAPQNEILRAHEFSAENSLSPRAVALRSPSESHSVSLLAGVDSDKDQSYFLWMVPETVLRSTLFPVGSLQKSEVRALAKKFGLPNAARKDSQGLCFLGDISIEDMLTRELAPMPGDVLDESGEVVGKHRGSMLYTLGQRHGFALSVQTGIPHFVIAKDAQKNTITVSVSPFPKVNKQRVSKTKLMLSDVNRIGEIKDGVYEARYRYRQKLIPCVIRGLRKSPGDLRSPRSEVVLEASHYAPAGQSLVLYDGERCLGGGIIEQVQLM